MNDDVANTGTVLVTLGRIEERLAGMQEKESRTNERLDKVETRLSNIELNLAQNVRPKAPWWAWIAGVGAVVLLAINTVTLINLLGDLAAALP